MRTLKDQLIEKGLSQPPGRAGRKQSTKARGKPEERLTARDWAYLMGTRRPTYGRAKGGAYRQR